jgi:hypothetical protein
MNTSDHLRRQGLKLGCLWVHGCCQRPAVSAWQGDEGLIALSARCHSMHAAFRVVNATATNLWHNRLRIPKTACVGPWRVCTVCAASQDLRDTNTENLGTLMSVAMLQVGVIVAA